MSEVKVNKITPTADCGTVTLGDSGDTVAIPSGVTLTSAGSITNSGTITNTGTISGGTITGTLDGQVNWQTTVKTTAFTATAGEGYFCNTTSAAFTVTLPASPSAGDIVGIKDYANTADTNNITIGRNGSNIQGTANDFVIDTEGLAIILLYVDSTKGWLSVGQSKASDITVEPLFTTATGGTITTSGDYKIHTFTGPGTFCVSQIGNSPTNPAGGPNTVSYMVVAGGGGVGPAHWAGGAGAGGFREGRDIAPSYTASPLAASSGLTIAVSPYPVTVGGGGSGSNGSNSIFSTITSAGGGYGGRPGAPSPTTNPQPGGSGAGNNPYCKPVSPVGAGNQPPVSPPQGNPGGTGLDGPTGLPGRAASGGGGGAGGTGGNAQNISPTYPGAQSAGKGGAGGNGVATSITGSSVTRAGGGAGSAYLEGEGGVGGPGGGGNGGVYNPIGPNSGPPLTSSPGAVNTGGGAGSCHDFNGNTGGSGIVVIRYKYQ